MILGIDAGGTNVDVVTVEDGRIVGKQKVPNVGVEESVQTALRSLRDDWSAVDVDRVVVATTIVVNEAVQDRLPRCTTVLIPGPGLDPERSFAGDENEVVQGCVDHRGRITEEVQYEDSPDTPVVAVVAKFASRNPALEREIRDTLARDESQIALGNETGAALTFPERAATTTANAKTMPAFTTVQNDLSAALSAVDLDAPVYYLKGDGAMLGEATIGRTPAQTLRCGTAASTLGLLALTDSEHAVCVDIGGTTTDVARVSDGFLDVESTARRSTLDSTYEAVVSESLPLGGDTRVVDSGDGPRFTDRREGNAAAFGGPFPTLTDALHVLGVFEEGDTDEASAAFEGIGDEAETAAAVVLDRFADRVSDAVDGLVEGADGELVVGGVLAPHLGTRIADRSDRLDRCTVPDNADIAGAIGCAVARVSLEVEVHIDSPRGLMTVTSVGPEVVTEIEEGRTYTDEEVLDIAKEQARAAAANAGGDPDSACEVLATNRFSVVKHRRVSGEIADVRARTVPGFDCLTTEGS